jgi:hypothetical protein
MTVRLDGLRRGVAQPGRAPGSGPGGRRFKSSLPDHHCLQWLSKKLHLYKYLSDLPTMGISLGRPQNLIRCTIKIKVFDSHASVPSPFFGTRLILISVSISSYV